MPAVASRKRATHAASAAPNTNTLPTGLDLSGSLSSKETKTELKTKAKTPSARPSSQPITMEPPPNWLHMIENIRRVRLIYPAPVDSMGCDQVHKPTDKDIHQRFHILVSLMLSSQTKDPITWAAVQKLKSSNMATADAIVDAPEKEIEDLIYPVSFYRRKAVYLKKVARIVLDKYQGDIPDSIKALCELPGVGPKMAHLCMQEAWNVNSGIGVDTHVHRIAGRLGWVPKGRDIKTPEQTREALESWLPPEYWREINHLLVGFGQTICAPVRPKCADCLNNQICPSSSVKKGAPTASATAIARASQKARARKESTPSPSPSTSAPPKPASIRVPAVHPKLEAVEERDGDVHSVATAAADSAFAEVKREKGVPLSRLASPPPAATTAVLVKTEPYEIVEPLTGQRPEVLIAARPLDGQSKTSSTTTSSTKRPRGKAQREANAPASAGERKRVKIEAKVVVSASSGYGTRGDCRADVGKQDHEVDESQIKTHEFVHQTIARPQSPPTSTSTSTSTSRITRQRSLSSQFQKPPPTIPETSGAQRSGPPKAVKARLKPKPHETQADGPEANMVQTRGRKPLAPARKATSTSRDEQNRS